MTIRRCIFGGVAGAVLLLAAMAQVRAQSPACLYASQSYSEGAYLCAHRDLMLVCTLDGGKPLWKPVADQTISAHCVADILRPGMLRPGVVRPHHHRIRRRAHRPSVAPPAEAAGKCFSFNGKRYCE